MTLVWWIIFAVLVLLTFAWFFFVYSDVINYQDTQLKILGTDNASKVKSRHLTLVFSCYFFSLVLLTSGFFVYFFLFHT